ncbi:hypothetical protein SAMN02745823_02166 [Sporobacter termitidis DSM 10068]|uniref:Uncharacterized protein n=1 Tax=Sporobacter termitidis DSM 10068 TaxID=1123282 RepID=A0A1M5Y281_9FIRM|nr:SurA N-terminal domain-containing protein [Sporobacter termitidis]SHI06195.1 hypothetical protein SAMN02745823_02166 [Sporobacter termitidis DSM 10068]
MGASQDKRKRGSDGFDFGAGRDKRSKESEKARSTARVALITVIVVAVLFAAALLINSDYSRQNFAAVKIDDVKYTVTDFNYYYENAYAQYYNALSSSGDFGQSLLPSQQESLKSQIYDETTGETWADFFKKMALEQMKSDNMIYKAALDAGYQLSDDDKKKMEDDIDSLKQNGYASGYTDLGKYLKAVYGRGMTEAVYRKNAERTYLINSYTNHVRDSFTYSSGDLEDNYSQNKDNFDTYTYRYFLVSAGDLNQNDYPDDASYEAAKGAAVEAAGDKAKAYAATVTSEQGFIDVARDYDPETNKEDAATQRTYQGNLLGSTYGDWMKDASRQYGDVETFKSTNGYYVVFFGTRSDNHYATVNMRQILVKPETIDQSLYASDPNEDQYNADVAKAKQTAEDTANKIYDEWTQAGATEDKLTELTTSYATEISADDSKQQENVYQQQLPTTINDWLYDPARKAGDHALLYDEATGYCIVYFEGQGKQYSDVLADKDKRDKDLQAWKDGLTGSDPKTTWLITMSA